MIEAWCIALAIPPKSPPDGRRRRAKMPPAVSPRVTALLRPRPTQRCRSTPTAGWMIRASQTIPITPRTSPPNTKWKLPSALKSEGTHQKLSPRADPPQPHCNNERSIASTRQADERDTHNDIERYFHELPPCDAALFLSGRARLTARR